MELFVTVYFITICLSLVFVTYRLCQNEYPQITEVKKGDDIFKVIISIGLALWSGILLFGGLN